MIARLQKSMKEKDEGFTLIELLVVIVIIGILAAIAIPIFLSQRQKGVDASLKSDLKSAATSLETMSVDDASWSATAGAAVDSVATDFTVSSPSGTANVVTFGSDSSGTTGYCLVADNTGASDAAPYYYNSNTGGLTTTPCA